MTEWIIASIFTVSLFANVLLWMLWRVECDIRRHHESWHGEWRQRHTVALERADEAEAKLARVREALQSEEEARDE